MMSAPDKLLTADELAAWFGIPRLSVYESVRSKGLPAIRIGRSLRFYRPAVEDWLARNTTSSATGSRAAD